MTYTSQFLRAILHFSPPCWPKTSLEISAAFVCLLPSVWLLSVVFHRFRCFATTDFPVFPLCATSRPFPPFPIPGSVIVRPPWRCSDAPQRALTPAHECDSERGTDAAKKRWGEGSDAQGWERVCASAARSSPSPSLFTCRPSPIPLAFCTARLRSA